MIVIKCPKDIAHADIPERIRQYFLKYIQSILDGYQVDTLQKLDCIYFLEQRQDIYQYRQMGLSVPLQKTPFEYGEIIRLKDSYGETELLHGCYLFNNDFAVDIFGERSIFDDETTRSFLDT